MKKRILFIATICLAVLLIVTGIWIAKSNNNKVEQPRFVIDSTGENDKLRLSTKKYVDSRTGETSVTVSATVNPSSVVNDKLTWTLEWSQISSENVFDYVTMNVSADTHSVTLVYKKNFNVQLILKATSVLTPSVNSTCTIDCYKRTTDFSLDFGFDDSDGNDFIPTINNTEKTVDFSKMTYVGLSLYSICDLYSLSQTGTVAVNSYKGVKFSLSSELKTKLTSAGITFSNFYDMGDPSSYVESIDGLLNELITITDSNRQQVYQILGTVNYWFDLTCEISDFAENTEVNIFTKVYKLQGFNIADGLSVTDINLNKNNIIF